jgi:hypothetical protein
MFCSPERISKKGTLSFRFCRETTPIIETQYPRGDLMGHHAIEGALHVQI